MQPDLQLIPNFFLQSTFHADRSPKSLQNLPGFVPLHPAYNAAAFRAEGRTYLSNASKSTTTVLQRACNS